MRPLKFAFFCVLTRLVFAPVMGFAAGALTITSPTSGSLYTQPVYIQLSSDSSDPEITAVEFVDNSTLVSKDMTAPFSVPFWLSAKKNGEHTLVARGLNSAGQVVATSQVQYTINLEAIPPSVPTGVVIEHPTCTQVKISWSPSTDNVGVVNYWVTRDSKYWKETKAFVFTLSADVSEGDKHFYAVAAVDAAGNRSAESGMWVTGPACPPKVPVITAPASGTRVLKAGNINVQANAPADFVPTKMEYYLDTTLIGTVTAAPYVISRYFNVKTNGPHNLTAKAYSPSGEVRVSEVVPISVDIETLAPTVPGSPTIDSPSCTEVNFSWTPSVDSGGSTLSHYVLLKNGKYLKDVKATILSHYESGLDDRINYTYGVYAVDSSGNLSGTASATKIACNPMPLPSPTPKATPTPALQAAAVDQCHQDLVGLIDQGKVSGEPEAFQIPITLHRQSTLGPVISFGVPFAAGAVKDPRKVSLVTSSGTPVQNVRVKTLLCDFDSTGAIQGARSVLIQFPASSVGADVNDFVVKLNQTPAAPQVTTGSSAPYTSVSFDSDAKVNTVDRTIEKVNTTYRLVESGPKTSVLFSGKIPATLAIFPDGYLARTGILGKITPRKELLDAKKYQALQFISDYLIPYTKDGMYTGDYAYNPNDPQIKDFATDYEGWLYDRCATYLISYAHTEIEDFYKYGLMTCSYYSASITSGGITILKPASDVKYSHSRGLYAYYALTGDEDAFRAVDAIARMWYAEPLFATPYRKGQIRSLTSLWTERLLATSMEGFLYGYQVTRIPEYSVAFDEILNTAYRHISTDQQSELDFLTRQGEHLTRYGTDARFPPQNCFVHNATQAAEGNADKPFCSGWMNELMLDVLLKHQEQTHDPRVDDIFIRLARFLRDTGTASFASGNQVHDSFLAPQVCYNPNLQWDQRRRVVPLYSAGVYGDGTRSFGGEWDDFQHCPDATALTAAAIRGLKRRGTFDVPGPAPFMTEGESFVALHQELAYCAEFALQYSSRPGRNPVNVTSATLAQGYKAGDPTAQLAWIESMKIGYPEYQSSPRRKLSWWFNMSLLQFGLMDEVDVRFEGAAPQPGQIQPAGCN